jgi:multicomponent Na+:H+ antiporter subunit C
MTAAIIVGLLAAGGTYLILQRGIVRIALGFVLLGHAATTLLIASGGVGRRAVPFAGGEGLLADPLPQAFALTAIVISFGITAFLLALAFRSRDALGHDDVEDRSIPEDRSFPDRYDRHVGERERDHLHDDTTHATMDDATHDTTDHGTTTDTAPDDETGPR